MNDPISITDNCFCYDGRPLTDDEKDDLSKLSLPTIGALSKLDGMLIFPPDIKEQRDKITQDHIVSFWNGRLKTGNIMGFVGINGTRLRIHSRFFPAESDYFLHYMLQRVFSINLFDLSYSSDSEEDFDFLLCLFPYFLKRAMRQGLFKAYRRFLHNDANIRGPIDVARHIRLNMPFTGRVAYSTREHTHDNDMTQILRHTIEYIAHHPCGQSILTNDRDTIDAVRLIRMATPSYNPHQRRQVVGKNLRPTVHPYFTEYRPLQQLCLRILRHEELKYGRQKDEIYGILFDGAWLWEEYLATILTDFRHPLNREQKGGIAVFKKHPLRFYPDFYRPGFVLDAKYKRYAEKSVQSEDYHQLIAYMFLLGARHGGFVVPADSAFPIDGTPRELIRDGGTISVYSLPVNPLCTTYDDYVNAMRKNEERLHSEIAAEE